MIVYLFISLFRVDEPVIYVILYALIWLIGCILYVILYALMQLIGVYFHNVEKTTPVRLI